MVKIENVSVQFRTKSGITDAVRNVSLSIEDGEIFGIVGASGAGKSTLLRTINMIERPAEGKVYIGKTDITTLAGRDLRRMRQKVGMIFQHFNLMHTRNVYENVALAMKIAGKSVKETEVRVPELLALVGLSEKALSYPSQLSGGQKQRVGIARSLANDPEILLCDEPTSALDLETTRSILDLIRDINRRFGITVILISHEMDVIKSICARVAVMENGKVVETNTSYGIFSEPVHETSKELVRHSLNIEVPENILSSMNGSVVRVVYLNETALEPVLSNAIKKFTVNINIIHGKIEYIAGLPIGILILNLRGKKNEINEVIEYLKKRTAVTEVIYG